jgi:hypothetical protein
MVVADKDLPPGAAAKKAWRRNRECAMTGSRRTAKARFSDEITYGKLYSAYVAHDWPYALPACPRVATDPEIRRIANERAERIATRV